MNVVPDIPDKPDRAHHAQSHYVTCKSHRQLNRNTRTSKAFPNRNIRNHFQWNRHYPHKLPELPILNRNPHRLTGQSANIGAAKNENACTEPSSNRMSYEPSAIYPEKAGKGIRTTCGMAIASLAFGISSFMCFMFTGLVGVILGVIALSKISGSNGRLAARDWRWRELSPARWAAFGL